jgi:hypothetical protein
MRRAYINAGLGALAALVLMNASPASAFQPDSHEYYRSTDGTMVHRPTKGNVDYGRVTAICGDGSRSFSHHQQGTCSHHGGVSGWR